MVVKMTVPHYQAFVRICIVCGCVCLRMWLNCCVYSWSSWVIVTWTSSLAPTSLRLLSTSVLRSALKAVSGTSSIASRFSSRGTFVCHWSSILPRYFNVSFSQLAGLLYILCILKPARCAVSLFIRFTKALNDLYETCSHGQFLQVNQSVVN